MPRFYFDAVLQGKPEADPVGIELDNRDVADRKLMKTRTNLCTCSRARPYSSRMAKRRCSRLETLRRGRPGYRMATASSIALMVMQSSSKWAPELRVSALIILIST